MPHRNVREDLPTEVRLALLEEKTENLEDEVRALKKAIYALIGTLLSGMLLFLFSVASGWLGAGGP